MSVKTCAANIDILHIADELQFHTEMCVYRITQNSIQASGITAESFTWDDKLALNCTKVYPHKHMQTLESHLSP